MTENLNAAKLEEFPQQSNFRPLWYWRLFLVWAMFLYDKPIKSFDEERQPRGGGIGGLGDDLWASRDHRHKDADTGIYVSWHKIRINEEVIPSNGDARLSWTWLKRQISKIKVYSQNTAPCILYLGVWAVHFNWLCVMTSSSSYLGSAIVWTPVVPCKWHRNK